MTDSDIRRALHDAMLKELLRKIQAGEATAADLNVARQYLKDANYTGVPETNPQIQRLGGMVLPFTSEPDEHGFAN